MEAYYIVVTLLYKHIQSIILLAEAMGLIIKGRGMSVLCRCVRHVYSKEKVTRCVKIERKGNLGTKI
jgi:hypothetical protein